MYQGSANNIAPSSLGVTAYTVVRTSQGLENENHKLFIDSLFTTCDLLKKGSRKENLCTWEFAVQPHDRGEQLSH